MIRLPGTSEAPGVNLSFTTVIKNFSTYPGTYFILLKEKVQPMMRIPKQLVRKGMYIEAVECSDLEFSGRRFLLQSDEVLRAILASSATDVLVNRMKSTINLNSLAKFETVATPQSAPQPEAKDETEISLKISQANQKVSQEAETLQGEMEAVVSGKLNLDRLRTTSQEIEESLEASPDVFLAVTRLKSKDKETYVHSLSVSAMMSRLGRMLDMDTKAVEELGIGGLLHDVGKVRIPKAILNKSGPLTSAERNIIRNHPEQGYRLLRQQDKISQIILDVCRLHHEALDGSGYPLGLKGDQINLQVRICTVCDVFDALTSVRPYKRAWTSAEALNWMYEKGHLFDRKLVLRLGTMFN